MCSLASGHAPWPSSTIVHPPTLPSLEEPHDQRGKSSVGFQWDARATISGALRSAMIARHQSEDFDLG